MILRIRDDSGFSKVSSIAVSCSAKTEMQRGQKEKSIKMKSEQDFILPEKMNKCRLTKRTSHPWRDHSAPSTPQPLGLLLLNLGPLP